MAGKQNKQVGFCGIAIYSPPSSPDEVVLSGGSRVYEDHRCGHAVYSPAASSNHQTVVLSGGSRAYENQNSSKAVYKHAGGSTTARFSQTEKAGSFVDRRSGNHGFKQEANYKSSVKVNDRAGGCTTEYETQVKVKKTTTYHNTPKNPYKSVKYYDGDYY